MLFCVERLTSFQCSRKSGRQTEREGGKEVGIEMQKAHRSAPSPVLILACVMGVGILWQTADNDGQGIIHVHGSKDDLADNHVPASDRSEHWDFIFEHRQKFVRHYLRHAHKDKFRLPSMKDFLENGGAQMTDAGGSNRNEAEELDLVMGSSAKIQESIAVTRCTSTQYAITAYYCGSKVADNQDLGKTNMISFGNLDSFEYWLNRQELLRSGMASMALLAAKNGETHANRKNKRIAEEVRKAHRSVFRFGISSGEAAIDHVWVIVGNPEGTFTWHQSYINEYSCGKWMERSKRAGFNPMNSTALRGRVALLRILEKPKPAWDQEADDAYFTLFDVRINDRKERQAASNYKHWDKAIWSKGQVSYDLACEWPLQTHNSSAKEL